MEDCGIISMNIFYIFHFDIFEGLVLFHDAFYCLYGDFFITNQRIFVNEKKNEEILGSNPIE